MRGFIIRTCDIFSARICERIEPTRLLLSRPTGQPRRTAVLTGDRTSSSGCSRPSRWLLAPPSLSLMPPRVPLRPLLRTSPSDSCRFCLLLPVAPPRVCMQGSAISSPSDRCVELGIPPGSVESCGSVGYGTRILVLWEVLPEVLAAEILTLHCFERSGQKRQLKNDITIGRGSRRRAALP